MPDTPQSFDIVIIGGGMVGAAMAGACRGKGWRIAVIDGQQPQREWPAGEVDLRVSALSRASQRIQESDDDWTRIAALVATLYREMEYWDAVCGATIHFDSPDNG